MSPLEKVAKRYFNQLDNADHCSRQRNQTGAMSWYLGQARGMLWTLHELGLIAGADYSFWMYGPSGKAELTTPTEQGVLI